MNTNVFAAVVVAFVIGYVLLEAQDTHDDTVALAQELAACQTQFNKGVTDRSTVSSQDNALSTAQSDLRIKMDQARTAFLAQILEPPPDVAGLPSTDPRREQYLMDVVRQYANWTNNLAGQIDSVVEQRKAIMDDRAKHPLPPFDCAAVSK